ncbi:hypothetical protein HZP82_04635 [Elizabethkingia anophelis]|nr:hypothetical protein [Elizabethkingia anophelis]MCT4104511.1 hypothetical protein [Elizabethkingia anophelis]
MTPNKLPQVNVMYGEGQEEYQPLPVYRSEDAQAISCWELTDEEIEKIKETKCLYLSMMTFVQPLQPVYLAVDKEELGI